MKLNHSQTPRLLSRTLLLLGGMGLALAAPFMMPLPSLAQQLDCRNAQTTVEMNRCASSNYQEADQRLNQTYRRVIRSVSGEQREILIDAQLAWIKFRDSSCEFAYFGNRGGSIYPSAITNCRTSVTNARTADFDRYLSRPR